MEEPHIRVLLATMAIAATAGSVAFPQELPQQIQSPPPGFTAAPGFVAMRTPEWMLWQAFHQRHRFFSQQMSVEAVRNQLAQDVGIDTDKAARLMALGEEYLQILERLYFGQSADIGRRYDPPVPPELARALERARPSEPRPLPPEVAASMLERAQQMQEDRRQRMTTDGLDVRFEAAHANELAAHQQRVRALLGDDGFRAVEGWIRSNYTEQNFKVLRFAPPSQPPPAPVP